MDSITLKDGFAFPFVRSDKKEIETPAFWESSCFVMPLSSSSLRMLVKKIRLYTIRLRLDVNFSG
ncbi:Uncharacterised protein [Klebsiella pneumoniae]|nr:hypothetical protein SL72_04953 [Klebsiella pneumoniae]KME86911.1 hypothetical protein SM17_05413 [Klebsiella pneumoniae]SBY18652.1 Uncharacterised protein [Klebsiella pneumoniae]SXV58917.1 Uncharacterised protein [Klebsiella pneumoniae]